MNPQVIDMECDGLNPTKIHCLVIGDDACTNYDDMRYALNKVETLVGHNIIIFDVPILERLLKIKVRANLIDTLSISWYLEPDRPRHGLESYGVDFGVPKPVVTDWEGLTQEEYVHRCQFDVSINTHLWKAQWKELLALYGDEQSAMKFIAYLSFKMDCAREQEANGWLLDVDRAQTVRDKLQTDKDSKLVELAYAMPKVPIIARKSRPAKPFKQNGERSKHGEDWFQLLEQQGMPLDYDGVVEIVKDYEEPNPSSHSQIKNWLDSLGWEPTTFIYKRDKETGDVRKIPQVAQEKTLGPGLCSSVKKLFDKEPKLQVLDGLAILSHRISILEGFLANVDERGYIKAQIQGFTNTLRFKHKTIVNLPGVHNAYGEDIRGCLIAPKGYELCGADMSSLEDRLKQHYIYPYDPEYVAEMNTADFDPHLGLARVAGSVDDFEVAGYKSGSDEFKYIKSIRHTYKQGNYACQYGAGGARIALTCGISRHEGDKIFNAYWKRNWAIKKAAEDQYSKVCYGKKWLYNPVSKFWYSLRHEKDRFSTLVQGTAVFVFDNWVGHVRHNGPPLIGQMHDEVILLIREGRREKCTEHLQRAIKFTNEEIKLDRMLSIDVQYANNYGGVH